MISGPSGAGKGTLVARVREQVPNLGLTVSATTRSPRAGEVDGVNYYFLTDEEVLDAAARYRRWWEGRKYPRTMWTIDPCYDEPLCGSSYMWW